MQNSYSQHFSIAFFSKSRNLTDAKCNFLIFFAKLTAEWLKSKLKHWDNFYLATLKCKDRKTSLATRWKMRRATSNWCVFAAHTHTRFSACVFWGCDFLVFALSLGFVTLKKKGNENVFRTQKNKRCLAFQSCEYFCATFAYRLREPAQTDKGQKRVDTDEAMLLHCCTFGCREKTLLNNYLHLLITSCC